MKRLAVFIDGFNIYSLLKKLRFLTKLRKVHYTVICRDHYWLVVV